MTEGTRKRLEQLLQQMNENELNEILLFIEQITEKEQD